MQKKLKIVVIFVLLGTTVWGQYGFQKVYNHHAIDTISIISDLYVQDDSIYFSGGGRRGNAAGLRFGQVNESGEIIDLMRYDLPDHKQNAYFSDVETDTNFRGNLVNVYKSRDNDFDRRGFRMIEYNLQGEVVFDSLYTFLWDQDSIGIFDHSKLIFLKDSSYLLNLNYFVESKTSEYSNSHGSIIVNINSSGEILWSKKYFDTTNFSGWSAIDFKKASSDNTLFHVIQFKRYPPASYDKNWAKHLFIHLDTNGNIEKIDSFQDGKDCFALTGNTYFDNDTIYLQYFDSKLYGESGNNDYFQVKPVLAKIDPEMNIIWKKELQDFWGNGISYSGSMQRIRKVNDTAFVAARNHLDILEGGILNPPITKTVEVRFYNFSANGEYNWIRDYHYYPLDSLNDATYEINDIEKLSDGGFVLGGQVRNPKFTSQNKPGQFAYLLRTNCLGFLSPPEAQMSYSSASNQVTFSNNSMNAGIYTWIFGDGDTLRTGEDRDTITHTYTDEGDYNVTLIGHGCNGAADTVSLQVQVEEGAYGNIGDHFFHLYPNPVAQGEVITVESGSIENASLQFYTMGGKKVKHVALPDAKSIYFIEHNFSSGGYLVRLIKNGKLIEEKKMVVQ